MIKYVIVLVFCFSFFSQAQELSKVKKTPLKVDKLINTNEFGNTYYISNNTLYKKTETATYNYANVQLGTITSANTFNALKPNIFYQDFNTAIILDNRLADMFKIDFNTIKNYKNVSHIATGNDNTIWIYNQNTNQLELFDYLNLESRTKTLPIAEKVIQLTSNYNYCFLLTQDYLYTYNYFGSLIEKIPNNDYQAVAESDENLVLLKNNQLYFKQKNSSKISALKTPELLIKQFLLTNETLYIYDGEFLHQFTIKTN